MTSPAIHADPVEGVARNPADQASPSSVLRSARLSRHMTQEVLASAAGVSSRTVIRAERGDEISVENLRAICSVLGLDAMELVRRPDTEPAGGAVESVAAGAAPIHMRLAALGAKVFPRLATWRFSVAAILMLVPAYAGTDYALEWVSTHFRPWEFADRQVSTVRGTLVAGRVNVVLSRLSAGVAPTPSDMGPNWDFGGGRACYTPLMTERLIGRTETCARTGGPRIDVRMLGTHDVDFVVGPVDGAFLEAFALQLAAPPGIALRVAVSADAATVPSGAFWFDPRGIDPRRLPSIGGRTPFLNVRISRAEATR